MKIKTLLKLSFIILIIIFLALYFMQATSYYQGDINKKSMMTEDAIKQFEKDLKGGKKIDARNYLEKEERLDNNLSNLGMSLSKLLEKAFSTTVKTIFNGLNSIISS